MAEERRPPALTESELDAALAEAFAAEPSPDFVARVRRRTTDAIPAARPFTYLVAASVLVAAAIVFIVVIVDRASGVKHRVQVVATSHPDAAVAVSVAPVVNDAEVQRLEGTANRPAARRRHRRPVRERIDSESSEVLIPVAEQEALRRLLERPPTAELVVPSARTEDPVSVAAIVIAPISINPLAPNAQDGGHQ